MISDPGSWAPLINQGIAVAVLIAVARWSGPRLDKLLEAGLAAAEANRRLLGEIHAGVRSLERDASDRLQKSGESARVSGRGKPTT